MQERLSPILATGATAATWLTNADAVLGLVVTVLTLAWWVRLWLKHPEMKPPQLPGRREEAKEGKDETK